MLLCEYFRYLQNTSFCDTVLISKKYNDENLLSLTKINRILEHSEVGMYVFS